jgi:hypothetical protein
VQILYSKHTYKKNPCIDEYRNLNTKDEKKYTDKKLKA